MIKLFEMFAGYGGASFALKKANINFECVGYSEIDKYAIKCYEQNHLDIKRCPDSDGKESTAYERLNINYGDCTKINPNDLPDFDFILLHSDVMWYNATEEDLYCPKCFEVWRFIEK